MNLFYDVEKIIFLVHILVWLDAVCGMLMLSYFLVGKDDNSKKHSLEEKGKKIGPLQKIRN